MVQYLLEDRDLKDRHTRFDVKKMTWKRWILVLFLTFITSFLNIGIFNFFIPGFGSFLFLTMPVLLILTYRRWKITGQKMLDGLVVENAKLWMHDQNKIEYIHDRGFFKDKLFRLVSYLLGVDFKNDRTYYLEGNVEDLDLSTKGILKRKYLDLFSACLGLTFLIATSIRTMVTGDFDELQSVVMAIAILVIPFSIYLVSWLIPMFWTLQDANIKSIDSQEVIHDFSTEIREGFISRFLGLAGFIIAYSECFRTAQAAINSNNINIGAAIFLQSLLAFIFLILFLLAILGTSVFMATIYLNRVHSDRVNDLRQKMSKILYLGSTSVRLFNDKELIEYFDIIDANSAIDADLVPEDDTDHSLASD